MNLKAALTVLASVALAGCGSMSFGETTLKTLGVFLDASEIKDCYDSGGDRTYCEPYD